MNGDINKFQKKLIQLKLRCYKCSVLFFEICSVMDIESLLTHSQAYFRVSRCVS